MLWHHNPVTLIVAFCANQLPRACHLISAGLDLWCSRLTLLTDGINRTVGVTMSLHWSHTDCVPVPVLLTYFDLPSDSVQKNL